MTKMTNRWGFQNNTKWALIESAPLTASGLNEILYMAGTKTDLLKIARYFTLKVSDTGRYQVMKLEDMRKTND